MKKRLGRDTHSGADLELVCQLCSLQSSWERSVPWCQKGSGLCYLSRTYWQSSLLHLLGSQRAGQGPSVKVIDETRAVHKEPGLILLSKRFKPSPKSRKLFLARAKVQASVPKQFLSMPSPSLWSLPAILPGLAFCQSASRPGQNSPRPQLTPWSLPWILKQTGYVLWLPTQPKGGGWRQGEAATIPAM